MVTSLTREQCEEAKIAFRLLEGRKKSLSYYVQFALERYREAEFEVTVEANLGSAETISADQATEIMEYLESYEAPHREKGFLVPYFALCLFAGIRPDYSTSEKSADSKARTSDSIQALS